jgi:hypothetical protein
MVAAGSNQYRKQSRPGLSRPDGSPLLCQAAPAGPAPVDHKEERDRSYQVRKAILGSEGRDGTGLAVTRRDITNYPADDPRHSGIPAGTVCQVTTTNAGFRGIEAYATTPDGTRVTASLGAFDPCPKYLLAMYQLAFSWGPGSV